MKHFAFKRNTVNRAAMQCKCACFVKGQEEKNEILCLPA